MTERTRVDQLPPGATFRLIAEWRIAGTDEMVPTTDDLTAFEVADDGAVVHVTTEVGRLDLPVDGYVDVVARPG